MNMLMNTVVLFPMERAVITREFQNGTYRMLAYYLARVITAITFQFIYVFCYVTVLYFLSGMYQSAQDYIIYVMVISLVGMIAVTLGLIIGAMVPSVNLGPSLVSPILMPLIIFSGYLITKDFIKPWFIWIYYISFFQYAFNILVSSQFERLEFDCCCTNTSATECYCDFAAVLPCPPACDCQDPGANTTTATYIVDSDCPLNTKSKDADGVIYEMGCKTGKDFLRQYSFSEHVTQRDAWILFGMWALMVVIGFFVLLWRGRKKIA